MSFSSWLRNWKRSLERHSALIQTHRRKTAASRTARRIGFVRPWLEILEDRLAPATLTVNSIADTVSGTTPTLDLREAILLVNSGGTATDSSGNSLSAAKASQISGSFGVNDTIQFDGNLNGQTITLSGTALRISQNVTITGPGAGELGISGNNQSGVFLVGLNATVSLTGLMIEDGNSPYNGGGGIFNDGALTLVNSTLSGNSSSYGGAVYNDSGTLTVSNSTIANNSALNGGGIFNNQYALVTLDNSTIANNSTAASGQGGGILNAGGTVRVINSTIADNAAGNNGYANGPANGGGIWNNGTLTLTNSTVADNSAAYGGGIYSSGGFGSSATLGNTIVANNSTGGDLLGSFAGDYDLIGDGSDLSSFGIHSLSGNPLLAPLGNYGGPTQTMALLPGSVAIGTGDPSQSGSTDQRGSIRGSSVDIGAYQGVLFTVTTTADSGPGSLRQAILDANNANAGTDTIDFDITAAGDAAGGGTGYNATTGVATIQPLSALPAITAPIFLDGTSQPGYNDTPLIVLSGVNAGSNAVGLDVAGGNSTVKGLVVNQFSSDGIDLTSIGSNVIEGDYIGTDATGSSAAGNGGQGVYIDSLNNTIGGTTASARNVISGNTGNGVFLSGNATKGTVIEGNYIGTDVTGTTAVANGAGVTLYYTTDNTIGGTVAGAGNLISGNSNVGIELYDSSYAVIQGNFIGTDKTGTQALGNGNVGGILLYSTSPNNTIGGTAPGAGNLISGNAGPGVQIGGGDDSGTTGNVVQGNFIGTDVTGTAALGNQYGVWVAQGGDQSTIGGSSPSARNVISGNIRDGVLISGAGGGQANYNVVQGNYIGVDQSGNVALANGGSGIDINGNYNTIGGTTAGAGNIISGNQDNGVGLSGTYNAFVGNLIGLGADGSTSLGNRGEGVGIVAGGTLTKDNTIGGTTPEARNVISGNGGGGIIIGNGDGTAGTVIEGNYIGTDAAGMVARPNLRFGGVWFLGAGANILGGTTPGTGNVISGNTGGVYLSDGTNGVQVEGNLIGLNATGTAALGNQNSGVLIGGVSGGVGNSPGPSTNNTVGAGNIISGNGGNGVEILGSGVTGNLVTGNYIGTDAGGGTNLGNVGSGVLIGNGAANNTVGGTAAGAGNTIASNTGAGVSVEGATSTGNAVQSDAIYNNSGGGIFNSGGTLTVSDSTIASNTAATGGGIFNNGTLTVGDSTIADNSATSGLGGGIANENGGSVTLNNTLVADNTSGGDLYLDSGNGSTYFGAYDLIGDGSDLSDFTNSLQGNPLLAPLGNYGGPTETMALLPGSPAIDAGSNALAVDASGNPLTTDQRGQPRIVGSAVDIGAFESQGFTLAVAGGNNQSTNINTNFANALAVTVTANNPLEPVDGGIVTFAAPSGVTASASFSPNPVVISGGTASVTATANGSRGTYTVTASASGANSAGFSLTNVASPPTASLTGPSGGVLYQPLTFALGASDPSQSDQAGNFTYAINWGDNTSGTVVGPSSTTATHTYTSLPFPGFYTVTVTATDEHGVVSPVVSQKVAIVATPQLQNGILAIPGTANSATITLTPILPTGASVYSMAVTETIGSKTTNLGTFAVPSGIIDVYGGPNTDSVILKAATTNDAFTAGNGTVGEQLAQGVPQATAFTVNLNAITTLTLKGDGGNDSLTGPNQSNSWSLTASNAGTLNGTTPFTGFGYLIGGSGSDDFVFTGSTASVSGSIDGGGGSNTLDFSARGTGVTVNLATDRATGIGKGWKNIAAAVGSNTSTLVGANMSNVWNITGANTGTVNGTFAFAGFQNLTGGSGNDSFTFQPGASLTGNLNGGAGNNTLDFSQFGSPVTVNLATKTATAIGGTWTSIQTFKGTATTDTLTGTNSSNTWSLTGFDAGAVSGVSFQGFGSLKGGSGNDVFKFSPSASFSGVVDGGAGTNTLNYSLYTSGVYVNLQTQAATGTAGIANIQNGIGSAVGGDILVGNGGSNVLTEIAGYNLVIGGGGSDTLTGGSGSDILIAGSTLYDQNMAALDALLAAWDNPSMSYSLRVATLQNGVSYTDGTGTHTAALVAGTTVMQPTGSGPSTLIGGSSGLDWFFAAGTDVIKNQKKGEVVSTL